MKDRWNGADLIEKKVRTRPSFASTVKDVVGGSNGYSGKFGDEEASVVGRWKGGCTFPFHNNNDNHVQKTASLGTARILRCVLCS